MLFICRCRYLYYILKSAYKYIKAYKTESLLENKFPYYNYIYIVDTPTRKKYENIMHKQILQKLIKSIYGRFLSTSK